MILICTPNTGYPVLGVHTISVSELFSSPAGFLSGSDGGLYLFWGGWKSFDVSLGSIILLLQSVALSQPITFHFLAPAEYTFPPARAAQGDSSQSPDKAAVFGGWSAQSPPPGCCWDRIHPQCAPTPPKSAAVRLHQNHRKIPDSEPKSC